jgi:RimJ/RimL family protein N-acetyltransferase
MIPGVFLEPAIDPGVNDLLVRFGKSNPFCTPQYVRAMQALGNEVWIVGFPEHTSHPGVAVACVRRGRLQVVLDMPSLPATAQHADFWAAVDLLTCSLGVTDLVAGTFGSPHFTLPPLRGEVSRFDRQEYVMQLQAVDLAARISPDHYRNVRKSVRAGLVVTRTQDLKALSHHLNLMANSRARRLARGETVAMDLNSSEYRAFLDAGAGEIFQAISRSGDVLSSDLVLKSQRAAYLHSSGSSDSGMKVGASHFLRHSTSQMLQAEGFCEYKLGGALAGSSLASFKKACGATPVDLCAATCYVGPLWRRKLRSAVRLARSDTDRFLHALTGRYSRLLVFALETACDGPAVGLPGVRLERLSPERLQALPNPPEDSTFRQRQLDRLERFGQSFAFGVYLGDRLAHISWLLPPDAVALEGIEPWRLNEHEVEITGCETLPAFRGKGLYPFAIQQLAGVAQQQGVRRIFMKTTPANIASQRGMIKAGLKPAGCLYIVHPPLRPSTAIVIRNFG